MSLVFAPPSARRSTAASPERAARSLAERAAPSVPAFSIAAARAAGILAAAALAVGIVAAGAARSLAQEPPKAPEPLAGTAALDLEGDIASLLVAGVDRFLLREIARSPALRAGRWSRDVSSPAAYTRSVEPNRRRLAHILGVRDERPAAREDRRGVIGGGALGGAALELVASDRVPSLRGRGRGYEIHAVRWAAFGSAHGEGLLLVPDGREPIADIVALPDADVTPEMLAGLSDGVPDASQFARRLVESGCRVVVPLLVDRSRGKLSWWHGQRPRMTAREFLHRSAYELGRTLPGYEVEKTLALVDIFAADGVERPIGVAGWGEGGLLALYSAALDPRIGAALVSGCFDGRLDVWQEPIDRNVFGLLAELGGAELASLVAPRALVVEAARGPEVVLDGEGGGAPARLTTIDAELVRSEVARAREIVRGLEGARIDLVESDGGRGDFACSAALEALLARLRPDARIAADGGRPSASPAAAVDLDARLVRAMREIDRHSQDVLAESQWVRKAFILDKLDTSSEAAYVASAAPFREIFRDDVIGRFGDAPLPPRPRTRLVERASGYTMYEVVLDVFPDVIAYGLLLLPQGIAAGERRPVVVCQHGLEGRPQSVIGDAQIEYYDRFASRLAERGFITFAPQNLYIFGDRFRTLQRKANSIGRTLFSVIVPQHQQIVDWLQTMPQVDPERIAFYGLSYGGKSAMRIPPLVPDYCLSICSADFNEWVDKNASTRNPRSYVWSGEYEIFEFDLGSTFNYAEMAALIAPRPFMVERGHYDGVADDWTVAWEFAKVQHLYAARLKMPERCEIHWFDGPHKIHGGKTYDFLHRHLRWPGPASPAAGDPAAADRTAGGAARP